MGDTPGWTTILFSLLPFSIACTDLEPIWSIFLRSQSSFSSFTVLKYRQETSLPFPVLCPPTCPPRRLKLDALTLDGSVRHHELNSVENW